MSRRSLFRYVELLEIRSKTAMVFCSNRKLFGRINNGVNVESKVLFVYFYKMTVKFIHRAELCNRRPQFGRC